MFCPTGVAKKTARPAEASALGWKNALLAYIAPTGPAPSIPPVLANDQVVVIKDAFPKARHHYLILSRDAGLNSIADLTRRDLDLLRGMKAQAQRLAQDIDESVLMGFHAIPSMNLLHLHVISTDFCSSFLKHKKHYLSFTTPFFLTLEQVMAELEETGRVAADPSELRLLLKGPLKCHRCDLVLATMPKLKTHLESHAK
ncbi:hypothetical protein HDV03_000297 [Kappamyces sp. JEL0829]|nr:hypothetical protein HDV03_000297 [Kappamyces sp. JEL0829]